jgi:hypothetical protein
VKLNWLFFTATVYACLGFSGMLFAQGDPLILGNSGDQSLGEVAKQKAAVHAKKVITDDDPTLHGQVFPQIQTNGVDNSDEIIAAIFKYSDMHKPADMEPVLKHWYQDEMDQVDHARAEISHAANKSTSPHYDNPDDYEKDQRQYREQAATEQLRTATKDHVIRYQNDVIHRIHDGLQAVKTQLFMQRRIQYTWFRTDFPYVIFYGPAGV